MITKHQSDMNALMRTVSEEEMDRLLEARHDEIVGMLEEAYAQKERGEVAELEPLDLLLELAHKRNRTRK